MSRKHSKTRVSIGELVELAYREAARLTRNPQVVAVLASKLLEELLVTSDHPELVHQFHAAS